MDFVALRTFLAVVETRSLVAASRSLHVTQSTVTARLNSLEREIGQRLLYRGKSGTDLTLAGLKFQRYAQLMVQLWRQAGYEISLPLGFQGVCNVGLEFDLWRGLGQRFLDYLRDHCRWIAVALWPGDQQEIDRWLKTGLIDVAFCYGVTPGGNFRSRVLIDDNLILVSTRRGARAKLDGAYVYVDHGDEFRRQHAAAFPSETTSALTIASSDWALDHLLRNGGSGYLSSRHTGAYLAQRKLHAVRGAPRFKRRVYLVESAQTVARWPWYEPAVASVTHPPRGKKTTGMAARGPALLR
jgi:LysR family transcriptional regulator, flagellar master operon regulator